MDRYQFELPLGSGVDRGMTVIRHGHHGRPVVVFPSEAGRAWDFEANGMVDAVRFLLDNGRVTLYCVDSVDVDTWSDLSLPTEERAVRHGIYTRWLTDILVPWIREDTSPGAELIATGCSLGAYHAVQLALLRADLVPLAIGLSGNYDVTTWRSWGERGEATYVANPTDYVPHLHGDHLDWLRSRLSVLLVVGQGAWETSPTRSAALHRPDGRPAAGTRHPLRAGPVGARRQPRLGLVAAAAGPPPAAVLLKVGQAGPTVRVMGETR